MGWTGRWPPASHRSARTAVGRVVLGVFRVGRGFVAALVGPGIEVGNRVHDAPAELAELRPVADHALFLQRARRKAQVFGGLVVGQVALGLHGRSDSSGGRPQGRSEEHTSELQSLMRNSYAVLCMTTKKEDITQ